MSGSPLRWPTKQVCIKCPFTQDLSSSPTGLYIYIVMNEEEKPISLITKTRMKKEERIALSGI